MENNGDFQEIPEKRKKRKIADLETPNLGSANVGANSSATVCTNSSTTVCTNPNLGAADQPRNKKKIIKLKNRKIEDLFIIRNFLPICEEFLVKNHESIFSSLLPKQGEEKNKTKGKGKSLQAITKGKPGHDEFELDRKEVQLEQNRDHKGGGIKEEERVRRKAKREKKSESVEELGAGSEGEDDLGKGSEGGDDLGKGSESVDDWGDGPTVDSEKGSATNGLAPNRSHSSRSNCKRSNCERSNSNRSHSNRSLSNRSHSSLYRTKHHRTNLYRNYVKHTKQCLREMDLPFDRAVLLNIVDKKDNTNKIMKIVNKKKVICAFGDTWEYMIEHIISLKEHKNLMKIYDIYDDDKNFYMIMEKLHGKELFSFLVYKKQVKESVCKYILSQIFQAVNYLHHHNIIHRDIKPENLMFRNKKRKDKTYEYNYELVLIDFDTCQFVYPPTLGHLPGKKHMKLVGTYGYIAPEIIKGYNYSILSDMWSIGIIFYILMTGITPLPMCLMVNYKNTKDIILKKEKKGINFSLLSFNSYPLARDLCEKLLQFDPAERMPNSVIASHHPWLRYFNMLGRNIHLCASEREYLSPSHLSQIPFHDAPYLKNKRPRYEDRNCHVILPYHMNQQVYQKEDPHPFLSLTNEQRYYYFINQGIRNYYPLGNDILPYPGLSTSLERFPYLRGGNLNGDTLPVCGEKLIATPYSVEKKNFEGKTLPVNYYQDRDSKHTPRISHQFNRRFNDSDGGYSPPGEGMASLRHVQKMRRGEEEQEDNEEEAEDDADADENAMSAQRRRPFRRKTGNILTSANGRVSGAALHESENGNYGNSHPYILTSQNLHSRDNDHPLAGNLDPISIHPNDEATPDCNNFVDLFEHLIENKKRKITMTGKPFDQLPPIENPFSMYYVANDEQMDGTNEEMIERLFKGKEYTTTKQKNMEYIRTENMSELFPCSPPMCVIPQNDPMKTIQIDQEYKRAYDFAPPRHVHLPNSHLALSHRGGTPNVILLPQQLSPSLLPLVYHHSNELPNSIVLNDKGHLTNGSDDIVGVINSDRHSSMCYANVATNAYDPCQVTNLYDTSTSLNEAQEQQLTLQEGHKNGMHSQQEGHNANLARTGISSKVPQSGTSSKAPQSGTSSKIPQSGTTSKVPQSGTTSKVPQNSARSMLPQNRNMPPIYVNYHRAYKNNIEMVPTMFRKN
ncbi:protein kinase domain containing protein [Plasmodium cynomolgi strain B]|uniref:Protein kinase domain containing protein n=1 Tax=Plasmodium cynomolgi (strain B) TaxID=1120755 RepID=K6UJX7_PLACD|nr:protein kinase domain containing protein [Plasmodium cynomolgi strain B]GAB66333.1 protein kinase domain containing protein [Plasmodium cynomolgi strain B]